jgi:hypothetical protein
VVRRRGRGKRLCVRCARLALLGGPPPLPLADMDVSIQRVSIFAALGISALVALYDGWLISHGSLLGGGVATLHKFVVLSLLATWVVADTQALKRDFPSLDHGWFVMFVPFYLTYYLFSTRRWRGLLILVGMMSLFALPAVVEAFF